MSVQTIHFLKLPPDPQKSTHQHFLSAKNPYENNKNQAKKLKVYEKNVDFHRPLLRKCMVCTLVKMLTFMDGPLAISRLVRHLWYLPLFVYFSPHFHVESNQQF